MTYGTCSSWSNYGWRLATLTLCGGLALEPGADVRAQTSAIVGATVIDGSGAAPLRDAAIVVTGKRITTIGPRASVQIPSGARVIQAAGKYVTPGFVDVNVHVTGAGFMKELFPLILYGEKDPFMKYGYALEAAQLALKFGVTTVRDTYGPLPPLLALRDAIARGEVVGPRLQVAGDILGWSGGPEGCTGDLPLDRAWCDYFRGYVPVGVELTLLYPDSVRKIINRYLDTGVDFVKYGATSHGFRPVYITFSPRVQRAIVEEVHERGMKVDVHAGNPEGLLLAVEAGVDVITHTSFVGTVISDEIVRALRDRKTICALFSGWTTGPMRRLLESKPAPGVSDSALVAEVRREVWPLRERKARLPEPSGVFRPDAIRIWPTQVDVWRQNDIKLIQGGCIIAVGGDNAPTPWPEITGRGPGAPYYMDADRPFYADPGIGTILAIEGLVELGMTPSEAIVAGTRNGAMATGRIKDFGTLEAGKFADLLILGADPLADISNIRKLEVVMKEGQLIEPDSLPTRPRYYRR